MDILNFLKKSVRILFVGPRSLVTPAHFVLGPRPAPRREKCSRTHEEIPNVLETTPRTILSSAL